MDNFSDSEKRDYSEYLKDLNHGTSESKKKTISEILSNGEKLLNEIDRKNEKKNIIKNTQIKFIVKYSTNYDIDDLNTYHHTEVEKIYKQVKIEKKSLFVRIMHFILNL